MGAWSGSIWGPGRPTYSFQPGGLIEIEDKETIVPAVEVQSRRARKKHTNHPVTMDDLQGEDSLKEQILKEDWKKRDVIEEASNKDEDGSDNLEVTDCKKFPSDATVSECWNEAKEECSNGTKILGIRWQENLVEDECLTSSPSQWKRGPAYKSVLKKTKRDSGLFDENMLSVLKNRPPKKNKEARLLFRSKEIKKKLEEMARKEEEVIDKETNKEVTVAKREDHEKEKGVVNVDQEKKENEAIEKEKETSITTKDCKICTVCKDKPKYGGPGKLKQSCKNKSKMQKINRKNKSVISKEPNPANHINHSETIMEVPVLALKKVKRGRPKGSTNKVKEKVKPVVKTSINKIEKSK